MRTTFIDKNGHERGIECDGWNLEQVREQLSIDLTKLEGEDLFILKNEPQTLVRALYIMTGADDANESYKEFAKSICGEQIGAAWKALLESLAFFFPESRRKFLLELNERDEDCVEVATEKLRSRETTNEIKRILGQSIESSLLSMDPSKPTSQRAAFSESAPTSED